MNSPKNWRNCWGKKAGEIASEPSVGSMLGDPNYWETRLRPITVMMPANALPCDQWGDGTPWHSPCKPEEKGREGWGFKVR